MRYLSVVAVIIFFAAALIAIPRGARSDGVGAAKKPDVKIAMAVVERFQRTDRPLRVIIENVSDKPQQHFDEWNSWGYFNLTLEWTDASGKTGTVRKVARSWTRNFPSTTTLKPGEALVREITFDPKVWQGWPDISERTKLALKVSYHVAPRPDADGWTGAINSEEQTVTIEPPPEQWGKTPSPPHATGDK